MSVPQGNPSEENATITVDSICAQIDGIQRSAMGLIEKLQEERNDLREIADEAAPFLRRLAKHCEDCEGSGEIVTGPNDEEATSEPCANCKPIWDLIERIEPKPVLPKPRELCGKEVHPGSPCLNDKGHEGECDDIPY